MIEIVPRASRDRGGPRDAGRGTGRGADRGTGRGAALSRDRLLAWLRGHGIRPGALPKSLTAAQWTELYHLAERSTGADTAPAPGAPARRGRARADTRARRPKTVSGE
ncbi:hypothetical protein [Streptomyces sp. 891-h]|uniref:hypothetical protein n=1 Tax=Streptomyces sp. 891-h TaxID=2720714 RepID=UPI001FAAA9E7|nr:hypothetical protein [Streptomyces sp. 891-h]UNZ19541.1 hypothetical protein HC362_23395 [Streptomyces sp. 891-h]